MSARRRKKAAKKTVKKAVGMPRRGVGTSGIVHYQELIDRIQPFELRWPQSMKTFEAMKNDDAIASVLGLAYSLIESAFSKYKIKFNKKSEKSKQAADYLNWCLNNMDGQSFLQAIRNCETFKEKGFSVPEKIYKKVAKGENEGLWKISQIANRPQASLDCSVPFEIVNGGRKIKSMLQNTQYFQNKTKFSAYTEFSDITGAGYKVIPRKKFMLFGDGATDSTPFGNPIFRACYKLWKEKVLLEDLEVNGASKDLAGIIDLAIPGDILEKAAADETSPEACMVNDVVNMAANVHAGEQPYFIRPSDLQDGSQTITDWGVKLLGLEGSGRQFNPGEMIQQRRKAIFDIWGAGHAFTSEGSVSYNSAEVKSTIHGHFIRRDINSIQDVLNRDLIPELLNEMNEFGLTYEDMPKIEAGEIDKISLDEMSKAVQRLMSVNGLVPTKDNILYIHKQLGFDTSSVEAMTTEEIITSMNSLEAGKSRAGESKGTSGTGNTQAASGGDGNLENTP